MNARKAAINKGGAGRRGAGGRQAEKQMEREMMEMMGGMMGGDMLNFMAGAGGPMPPGAGGKK